MTNPTPAAPAAPSSDEPHRLAALARLEVLGEGALRELDVIAELAARLLRAPMVTIGFADARSEWIKAAVGISGETRVPRESSLAAPVMAHGGLWWREDATAAPGLRDASLVQRYAVRFAAGAPIRDAGGLIVGALCVMDTAPRKMTPEGSETLLDLAMQIEAAIETHFYQSRIEQPSPSPDQAKDEKLRTTAAFPQQQAADLAPPPAALPRRRRVLWAGVLGLLVTAGLTAATHRSNRRSEERHVEDALGRAQAVVETRLASTAEALRAGSQLIETRDGVLRGWPRVLTTLNRRSESRRFPVAYVAAVRTEDTKSFEDDMRARLSGRFTIRPRGTRATRAPVLLFDPPAADSDPIGFDLLTDATLAAAAESARDTGEATLSARTSFGLPPNAGSGVVLFQPVFENSAVPMELNERRSALLGWLVAPLSPAQLLERSEISNEGDEATRVSLFDGPPSYETLLSNQGAAAVLPASGGRTRTLATLGRTLTLVAVPARRSWFTRWAMGLWVPLLGGLLTTLLAVSKMWSDERSRGALTIVKKQRKALRDNDSRVRALVDHVADGIITYDRYGTIRTFNRAAERIFGHPPSAVIGTDINALLPREAGDPTVGTHGEVAGVRANGARFEAAVSIAPVIGSEPPLFVAIVNDVTEQRIAERHIAAQNALTRVLAESPSLDEAARSILRIVGTDIECTAGALWLPTPDARQLERVASWGVSPADERTLVQTEPSGRLPAGRRLAGRVWMTGRAAQAVDPQRLSPHDRLATVQLQTRLGLPLFGKAGVVGVMEFVSARFDTELSKREQVLNIVGQAVGPFIERKQTEAALIESEARYRELFATAHDLIQSVDLNGRVLFVNRAWREALGYTDADLADLNILSVLAPQSREHCTTMLAALARGEAPATPVEMVLLTKSGEEIAVEGSVAVRRDQDHLSTLGIFRNVTAERAVERLKQEFVSTVSHELRTPLASIRGSLGLLAAGALGELSGDAREAVQIADRNVVRLLALINDILDLDRLESGRLDMAFGPCEMKQLISRAVEAVSGFADQRRVRMEVPSSAGEAFADGDRIIQVLVNLLSNAAKFSQPGGVVTLGSEEREGWIAVFVRDKGPGIAPVHRRAIFERFRQIAPPGPKSAGGTGLGLAICKTIVEQHGGRIDVESRENEGSVFWFTIPATAVPLSARGLAAPDLTGC